MCVCVGGWCTHVCAAQTVRLSLKSPPLTSDQSKTCDGQCFCVTLIQCQFPGALTSHVCCEVTGHAVVMATVSQPEHEFISQWVDVCFQRNLQLFCCSDALHEFSRSINIRSINQICAIRPFALSSCVEHLLSVRRTAGTFCGGKKWVWSFFSHNSDFKSPTKENLKSEENSEL